MRINRLDPSEAIVVEQGGGVQVPVEPSNDTERDIPIEQLKNGLHDVLVRAGRADGRVEHMVLLVN